MINVVSLVGSVCCEDDEETKRIRLLEAADQFFYILRERDELAYINTWVNLKTQLYLAGESLKTSLGKQLPVSFKAANKALAKRLTEIQKSSLDEVRQNPDYNYNDFIAGWRNLFKTYVQNFTNETSTAVSAANVYSPRRDVQSPKKVHSSPPKATPEKEGSNVSEDSSQLRKSKSARRVEESEEPTALNKGGRPRVYAVPGAEHNAEHEGNDEALMRDEGEDAYVAVEGEENVPVPKKVSSPSRARTEKSPKSKSWGASALNLLNGLAETRPPKGKGLGYTSVVKKFRDNIRDPLEKTVKDINRQQQVRKKPSFFDRRDSAERVSWDDDEELDSQPRSRHRSERPASSSPKKRPTQPMTPEQRKRPRVASNGPSPYRDQRSADGFEKRARRQVESENEIEESEVDSEGSSPLSSSTSSSPPRFKAVSPARISNVRPSPRRQVEDTSPVAHTKRRRPVPWTKEEEAALEEGMEKFGSSYAEIIKSYGAKGLISNALANRTQVQLKDKARNIRYRRERDGVPLGPFKYATVYPQNRA
ncbi:hypothetical protein BKA69DRAFT_368983 [Paraphysoderma sedebokerense]|nr:hypothetical protein BKA69DRAFT_368983 [Paraphysoderma sedebokerense]